jgi:hypothetical protein
MSSTLLKLSTPSPEINVSLLGGINCECSGYGAELATQSLLKIAKKTLVSAGTGFTVRRSRIALWDSRLIVPTYPSVVAYRKRNCAIDWEMNSSRWLNVDAHA